MATEHPDDANNDEFDIGSIFQEFLQNLPKYFAHGVIFSILMSGVLLGLSLGWVFVTVIFLALFPLFGLAAYLGLMFVLLIFVFILYGFINSELAMKIWDIEVSKSRLHFFIHGLILFIGLLFAEVPLMAAILLVDMQNLALYGGAVAIGYIVTSIATGVVANQVALRYELALDLATEKIRDPAFQKHVISTLGSIVLAMLIAALAMIMSGYNPLLAYVALMRAAIVQWDQVLFYATPLIFTGLSVALAFKCGLFNIGPEGQVYVGSLAATVTGYAISLPVLVHPIAALAVGAFIGGIWGFIPGLLRAYRGAHEVVTTMMLSYTAILLTHYLVSGPFLEPGNEYIFQTPLVKQTAELPFLYGNFFSWAFILALLAVLGVDILINRTVLGYEMRAVGSNLEAAEYGGINAKTKMALSLAIAGGLAGLGGAAQILGYHHRFIDGWSSGLGWDGITVAVLGANNPYGVLFGAIFFGALNLGGRSMQRLAGVPSEMVSLIQGLIVVFVAAPRILNWLSDRGLEQAKWMKEKPRIGMTHFLAISITLVSSLIGLTLVGPYVAIHYAASGLVIIAAVLGIVGAVLMLTKKILGLKLGIISGIFWLFVAAVGVMAENQAMIVTAVILGVLTLIFDFVSMRMIRMEEV